jgi:hypothetical protein
MSFSAMRTSAFAAASACKSPVFFFFRSNDSFLKEVISSFEEAEFSIALSYSSSFGAPSTSIS